MTGGSRFRTVNIDHDLDAQFPTPLHRHVPDVEAVLDRAALDALLGQFRIAVLVDLGGSGIRVAVFPLEQNFRRHGNTEKVESVVGDLPEHIVHVLGPYPVENLTADIVAEPVAAGDPDRIAVLVYDLGVVVDVQPVVVVAVRLCGSLCREGHRRSRCAGKHGSRQSCRQQ